MGRARRGSDLDLAVLFSNSISAGQVFQLRNDLAELLSRDVDLIDLAHASTVLGKKVLRTGKMIS